jgi:hypothetical protein
VGKFAAAGTEADESQRKATRLTTIDITIVISKTHHGILILMGAVLRIQR